MTQYFDFINFREIEESGIGIDEFEEYSGTEDDDEMDFDEESY